MSKRNRARNRHERQLMERAHADGDGHEPREERALPPPAPLTPGVALDRVAEIVARQAQPDGSISRQPRFTEPGNAATLFSSVYRWVKLAALSKEPSVRDGVRIWDDWLRLFALREPYLAGVLNSVIQIDKNRGWSLTGGRNQVARYTAILRSLDGGAGWREYAGWQAQSYYTTRMGFVSEIGRDGENGPLRALWSVDPARCDLTGNPEKPLRYYPRQGGQQEWAAGDFFRAASLQSTDEALYGLGYPAILRCYDLAKIMVAVWEHDQEQLAARAPKGLLLLHGIGQTEWEDAMEAREENLAERERDYYGGVAVLASSGADEISAALVALSHLPKDFDIKEFTDMLMYGYSLAFGYDAREFWPVSQGSLGTGRETDVQHRKASSKGDLDFSLAHQERIQALLPPAILFEYQQRDVSGEADDVKLQLAKAQVISELAKWGVDGQSVLSRDQILQLAVDQDIIPKEWAAAEKNVTATDTDSTDVARMLAIPEVRRAIELYPDEALIRYDYPVNRTRVLSPLGGDLLRRRSFPACPSNGGVARSIDSVASSFRRELYAIVNGALMEGGAITRDMRSLVKQAVEDAYYEGLAQGGVAADEADETDALNIVQLDLTQQDYVVGFSAAVRAAAKDGTADAKNAVLARIDLWTASIAAAGMAGLNSAQANEMVRFAGPDGDESCADCQRYKREAHRRKWFQSRNLLPAMPGSALACGGWQCQHTLEPVG